MTIINYFTDDKPHVTFYMRKFAFADSVNVALKEEPHVVSHAAENGLCIKKKTNLCICHYHNENNTMYRVRCSL